MTLIQFLGSFLNIIWNFVKIPFPATNVPIGAILIFPAFLSIAIRFIKSLFNTSGGGSTSKGGSDE